MKVCLKAVMILVLKSIQLQFEYSVFSAVTFGMDKKTHVAYVKRDQNTRTDDRTQGTRKSTDKTESTLIHRQKQEKLHRLASNLLSER